MRLFLIIMLLCIQTVFANEQVKHENQKYENLKNDVLKYQINKEYASSFSKLIVQSKDGRMKPLDSLNIDILNKISSQRSFYGLNHNQVILGMMYAPMFWQSVPMFEVDTQPLKKVLNTKNNRIGFIDFFDAKGKYKLQQSVDILKNKKEQDYNGFEKELAKVHERVQIAIFIYNQGFLKIYPLKYTKKWYSPVTLKDNFKNEIKHEAQNLFVLNKNAVTYALRTKNWQEANKALEKLKKFQVKYGKELIPSPSLQKAELFYNKLLLFEKLYPVYFLSALLLLGLIFARLFSSKKFKMMKNILVSIIAVSFFAHTFALVLRWYISEHAPWSNAYESMVFISWCIVFAGVFFIKKSEFALSSTTLLGSILLFVAHLSWMDPQITTLTPSLQSIWLTIHVAVISASYGFLALSLLLGLITLILMMLKKKNTEDERITDNIKEAFKTNELSMILGLMLLTIGTLLGSVWANESWGRIWEWDPKETWSLASILVYMVILHLRFVPKLNTIYNFSVLSIVGYSTILMTYFGVNYFFDAIHVYASNTNAQIPDFVYFVVAFIVCVIAFSYKSRKMEVSNG